MESEDKNNKEKLQKMKEEQLERDKKLVEEKGSKRK